MLGLKEVRIPNEHKKYVLYELRQHDKARLVMGTDSPLQSIDPKFGLCTLSSYYVVPILWTVVLPQCIRFSECAAGKLGREHSRQGLV